MQAQSRRNSGEAIATPETKKDTDSYESRSTHTQNASGTLLPPKTAKPTTHVSPQKLSSPPSAASSTHQQTAYAAIQEGRG